MLGCDSIGPCEEKESYCEHVSNSECLTRQSCLNVSFESVRFLFLRLDEERSLQDKGGHSRLTARFHFGCCCLPKENVKINSDEQHAIFTHELQSLLRLTVGFSNIYCEL
jgi:hypothetical protein